MGKQNFFDERNLLLASIVFALLICPAFAADKAIIFRSDDAQAYWSVNALKNVTDTLMKDNISQTVGLIPFMEASSSLEISSASVNKAAAEKSFKKAYDKALREKKLKNLKSGGVSIAAASSYISFTDDQELVAYLNSIKNNPSVEIALHGFVHSENEFGSMTYSTAFSKISSGKGEIYNQLGITTTTFVPPYHAFNTNTLNACKNNSFNRFSAGLDESDAWKESPAGLLHIPATIDFYDYDYDRYRTSSEIISACQSALDTYNACIILMHPWEFMDSSYTYVDSTKYKVLTDVVAWVKQKRSDGVKLQTVKQFGAVTCSNQCSAAGQKQCSGNGYQTCGDTNNDTCLEWSAVTNCTAGQVCQNGTCVASCTNECTVNGTKECSGGGYRTCGNYDSDTCLEWSNVTNCSVGQTCSNGTCITPCANECSTSGAKQCSGSGYQTCGNYDTDSCLEWSTITNCSAGQICSGGVCVSNCTPTTCSALGYNCGAWSDGCSGTLNCGICGTGYACIVGVCTCQPKNCSSLGYNCDIWSDGCGGTLSCGTCSTGQICSSGQCVSNCTNDCSTNGSKQCSGSGYQTCGDYDTDSCLEWSVVTNCSVGQTCSSGTCINSTGTNTSIQKLIVSGSGDAYETSGKVDLSSQYTAVGKSGTTTYKSGYVFANVTVPNGATILSAKLKLPYNWRSGTNTDTIIYGEASDNAAYFTTTAYNITNRQKTSASAAWNDLPSATWGNYITSPDISSIVREITSRPGWSSGNSVAILHHENSSATTTWEAVTYEGCGSTICLPVLEITYSSGQSCSNECSTSGAKQCSGSGYQTCGNYDTDSCLEWSTVTNCSAGQVCSNGTCIAACTPKTCSSLGYNCGSWSDGCNGTLNCGGCSEGYTCQSGSCVLNCTNECAANGTKECSGDGYRTCGNYDSDSCLEWSETVNCSAGQTCQSGDCVAVCADECTTADARQCSGTAGYQICGNYDSDSCLEWSSIQNCSASETCVNNTCATPPANTTQTIQRKVVSGKDDAYEKNGFVYTTPYYTMVGKSGTTTYKAGYLFTNVTVPKGAAILSAKLKLPYNWRSGSNADTIIYGEAADNAAYFTTSAYNISRRQKTIASVAWNDLPSTTWGQFITSPDISGIVKEIIARPGWSSGKSIGILHYENSSATSIWEAVTYEGCGSTSCVPILEIQYSS